MNSPIEQREVVARIIDPDAWWRAGALVQRENCPADESHYTQSSLEQADAILSAIAKAEIHSLVEEDEGSSVDGLPSSQEGSDHHGLTPLESELLAALRPFSEAAHRINHYDGEHFNGTLFAMLGGGGAVLHELLDGIDGEPLKVEHLRAARSAIARAEGRS